MYTLTALALRQFKGSKIQLLEMALSEDSKRDKKNQLRLGRESEDWYASKSLFQQLGLGYFTLNLDLKSSVKCELLINKKQLASEGLNLLNKAFKENYYSLLERGSHEVLVFEFVGKMTEVFSFPPNSLELKMII